jgi:predicted RecA/RadA family phage recombinase
MTTALVQDGTSVAYTCTGNVTAGNLYSLGVTGTSLTNVAHNGMPAVAINSGTTGDEVTMKVEGVFSLSKIAEAASSLVVGQKALFRTTGGVQEITGVLAAADGVAGQAWAAAVTGATTAIVRLAQIANYALVT